MAESSNAMHVMLGSHGLRSIIGGMVDAQLRRVMLLVVFVHDQLTDFVGVIDFRGHGLFHQNMNRSSIIGIRISVYCLGNSVVRKVRGGNNDSVQIVAHLLEHVIHRCVDWSAVFCRKAFQGFQFVECRLRMRIGVDNGYQLSIWMMGNGWNVPALSPPDTRKRTQRS